MSLTPRDTRVAPTTTKSIILKKKKRTKLKLSLKQVKFSNLPSGENIVVLESYLRDCKGKTERWCLSLKSVSFWKPTNLQLCPGAEFRGGSYHSTPPHPHLLLLHFSCQSLSCKQAVAFNRQKLNETCHELTMASELYVTPVKRK